MTLAEFRKSKFISLNTVSKATGIKWDTLRAIEERGQKPHMGTVKKLCEFYKIDYATFESLLNGGAK